MRLTSALALTTKAIMPTGGNTSPMDTISMDITPNQTGSKPSETMSGKVSCSVSRSSGSSSMNILTTKYATTMPQITTQRFRFSAVTAATTCWGIWLIAM